MNTVLVIDTSLAACSAGLYRDTTPIVTVTEPMQRGHQERLGPMVASLFDQAGLRPRELSHIGVTLGPGSFTGLRVGLSFAKGLAVGLGLNLQGIGTLEALGHHPDLLGRTRTAVIDGGRGQIYIQTFDVDGQGTAQAIRAGDAVKGVLTGPGAALIGGDSFEQSWPCLDALAALTLKGGHDDVTPLYMRDADAIASTRGIIQIGA